MELPPIQFLHVHCRSMDGYSTRNEHKSLVMPGTLRGSNTWCFTAPELSLATCDTVNCNETCSWNLRSI